MFCTVLYKHGIQLYPVTIPGMTCILDGHHIAHGYMSTVFEAKAWKGSGSPEVQSSLYWLRSICKTVQSQDPQDLLPCIIKFLIGVCLFLTHYPCLLSIGLIIGFSGVALTEHVQLEILTELIPLHTSPHNDYMAIWVAHAFAAYRIALTTIEKHYQELTTH